MTEDHMPDTELSRESDAEVRAAGERGKRAATRPSHCAGCGRPVHPRGTRADARPANSVLYRGNQLCVECAPARTTTGQFGRFQMRRSHLRTGTSMSPRAEQDERQDGARW